MLELAPAAAVAELAEEHRARGSRAGSPRRTTASSGDEQRAGPRPDASTSTRALERPHGAREAHRRQAHHRHALDVLDRRVRREQLEVGRHDRQVDVGPAHRAQQRERLVVRARRSRRSRPSRSRARRRARVSSAMRPSRRSPSARSSTKPTSSRPYSGWASILRRTQLADRTGADDDRPARAHHGGQQPGAQRAAERGDQHQRDAQEHQRLERRVDRQLEGLLERPGPITSSTSEPASRRVEQLADLVEAGRRDRAGLALVEPVRGEHDDPGRATPAATATAISHVGAMNAGGPISSASRYMPSSASWIATRSAAISVRTRPPASAAPPRRAAPSVGRHGRPGRAPAVPCRHAAVSGVSARAALRTPAAHAGATRSCM